MVTTRQRPTTRRRRRALGATIAAVAVAALAALAVSTLAGAAPPSQAQHDITVLVGSDFLHKVDEPPAGRQPHDLSAGDTLLHHDPVLDPDSGEQIGTAVTRVQAGRALGGADALFILDCTVRLANGNLVFYGPEQLSNIPTGTTYSLIGGTGSYAGAEGTVEGVLDEHDGQDVFRLHFDLTRP